jgi:hypothetical protein
VVLLSTAGAASPNVYRQTGIHVQIVHLGKHFRTAGRNKPTMEDINSIAAG